MDIDDKYINIPKWEFKHDLKRILQPDLNQINYIEQNQKINEESSLETSSMKKSVIENKSKDEKNATVKKSEEISQNLIGTLFRNPFNINNPNTTKNENEKIKTKSINDKILETQKTSPNFKMSLITSNEIYKVNNYKEKLLRTVVSQLITTIIDKNNIFESNNFSSTSKKDTTIQYDNNTIKFEKKFNNEQLLDTNYTSVAFESNDISNTFSSNSKDISNTKINSNNVKNQ